VIAKREVATASNENKNSTNNQTFMYYLNDGTYTSFMPLMLERLLDPNKHMIPQLVEKRAGEEKKREGELFSSTIWGPTCDGVDWIARDVMLPEFFEGEFFAFGDMGAYNQAMSTLFNGMPLPRSFYVANESWWDTMVELD
jgi:diaminopimelate decarboxylase